MHAVVRKIAGTRGALKAVTLYYPAVVLLQTVSTYVYSYTLTTLSLLSLRLGRWASDDDRFRD